MSRTVTQQQLISHIHSIKGDGRLIVAVAGPPGSGKSTITDQIIRQLNADQPDLSAVLPMDGFHYDDAVLLTMGRKQNKGAPDTFDVGGFHALLKRIKANEEPNIAVPVFDRDLEVSRGSARLIPASTQIILAEGNWLLLNDEPWPSLRPYFDLTVMITVPEDELRRRLTERWQGYDLSTDEIASKLDDNDLPNGRRVVQDSMQSDFIIAAESE